MQLAAIFERLGRDKFLGCSTRGGGIAEAHRRQRSTDDQRAEKGPYPASSMPGRIMRECLHARRRSISAAAGESGSAHSVSDRDGRALWITLLKAVILAS